MYRAINQTSALSVNACMNSIYTWLIGYNGKSTRLELFYADRSDTHAARTFIFTFLMPVFLKSIFTHGASECTWFFDRSIWFIDETLASSISQGSSEPGNNANEFQFSVTLKTMNFSWVSHSKQFNFKDFKKTFYLFICFLYMNK